ncbi:MAG: PBP1A family penicillin-binding protein [Patescibacteria group bacterium]
MPIPNLRVVSHSSGESDYRERPPKKRKTFNKKMLKKIAVFGFYGFCGLVVYLIGAFAWYSRELPDPNKILERNIAQSTKIYDREGKTILYDVHGNEQRTLVKLSDIPDFVKWATISAEDKTFYEHKGFNLLAMFKGTIIDPLLGRRARGGSTLTQQFVKNSILTNERRISRKIKEFILSYKIEKIFSKDEILQMYLNEIPYGSVAYGVQSASQTFFGKEVKDLTLGESAILAGIPQAPTYYSPYGSHVKDLFNRQKYVLKQMVDNGYISQEQADEAQKQEIRFALKRQAIIAPHFVMYVKEILSKEFGEEFVETGGLKVTTTLDLTKQKIAEDAVVAGVEKKGKEYNFNNSALISLDPKNGQILAMVGSKDYFDLESQGNFNVTTALRQPGSSIKPLVYLTAFEKGYTPDTVLYDVDTIFKNDGEDYHPFNYDGKEHGPVTLRQALAGSLNIPAVKTLYLVGVQNMVSQLQKFGYTSFEDRSRFGLSLVLGGGEVRPIEHAAAYATIANDGVYNPPAGILKVEDSKGNILLEFKEKSKKVIEPKYLDMLTSIMSDDSARAYVFGANGPLTLQGRPVAVKTGTTNDYKDAWTAGFTPALVSVVWVGNNSGAEMKKGADGSVIAAPIWNEYMRKSLENSPVENFRGYVLEATGKPVLDGNVSGAKILKIDKFSNKLATEYTPSSAIVEKNFREAHCLLHYVYKDDPRGDVPSDPVSADPAYIGWEEAVQTWVQKQSGENVQISTEPPPTDFDDLHTLQNKPSVYLTSPSNNSVVTNMQITATASASAPRIISRVEYYLDNVLLETKWQSPYDLNYVFRSYFTRGYHKLKVVAYDDVDNSNEALIDLNIQIDLPMPGFSWLAPAGGSILKNNGAVNLSGNISDLSTTKKINFYVRNKLTGVTSLIGTVIAPITNMVEVSWTVTNLIGSHELFAELIDQNNNKFESERVEVTLEK